MCRFFGYLLLNILLLGLSPIATVSLFSALGKGPELYVYLHDQRDLRYIFGAVGAVLCLAMYLGDLCLHAPDAPDSHQGILPGLFPSMSAKVLAVCTSVILMLAWIFSIGIFPSAPLLCIQLFLHGMVLFMAASSPSSRGHPSSPSSLIRTVTETLMPTTRSESFNIAQVCALIVHGLWTLFLWLFWVGDSDIGGGPHSWNDATRNFIESQGINQARFGASVRNVQLYLWLAPLISSMGLMTAAVVVMCVGALQRTLRSGGTSTAARLRKKSTSDLGSRNIQNADGPVALTREEESKIGTLVFTIKLLTAALVILCGCLWITASIVGSSLSLASTVQAFTVVFAGFLVVYIYIALSGENRGLLQRGASASPLMRSARGLVESDMAMAILLGMIFIPLPLYLALSVLNQLVRRCRGTAVPSLAKVQPSDLKPKSQEEEAGTVTPAATRQPGWLTIRVEHQMRQLMRWNWTMVHKNLQLLCMLAVSLQVVGGMVTNIVLAWVNAKLDGAGFTTLSAMFFLVGTGMFMIPIVPGIAVYLFGGILIPAGYVRQQGTPNDYSHDSFWIGFGIACLLNFCLKMVAIILQQKGIGEPMSTNLWVLQTVGANTPQMKAVERILRKPGLNFPKVTILCGGPDWPTSVLTGILRLSLPQMLLGSIPVIFNVVFVCAAGSFRLRESENETWSAMSSVALTVASVWTVMQMALAAYFIQETWEAHHTELSKPRKEHVALDWLDHVAAEQQQYKGTVMRWGALPLVIKACISSASVLMLLSTFYMIMMQSRCWDNFEVTDDIASLGLHFVRSEGWAAIGVFSLSCALHVFVQIYMRCITRRECKAIVEALQPTKSDWVENRNNQCQDDDGQEEEVCFEDISQLRSALQHTTQELRELKLLLEQRGVLDEPPAAGASPGPKVGLQPPKASVQGSPAIQRSHGSDADTSSHDVT